MTSNNNEINATLNGFITVYELRIVRCEQQRAIRIRCDFMIFYFIRFLYRINLNIFILIQ